MAFSRKHLLLSVSLSIALAAPAGGANAPTAADAAAFITAVEKEVKEVGEEASRDNWIYNTYITYDTEWLVAKMNERTTEMSVRHAVDAKRFNDVKVAPDVRRKLEFLKQGITLPAPQKPG